MQYGKLQHFAPADGVYVYFRYDENDTVMVALNRNAEAVPLALDLAVRDGRIKRGDLVVLEAMGGGFTWGAAVLRV